ncbi:hypothetical protein AAES_50725 [Amazona aestiva]|uniref:Uncharacterized protein n=1 Tax=Amazona aestiva TaxID=12930 RepID=A0A0Q3MNZ9_AMAAE|nr:hypothetical protein AAES_50725 [Amazona aestiva]
MEFIWKVPLKMIKPRLNHQLERFVVPFKPGRHSGMDLLIDDDEDKNPSMFQGVSPAADEKDFVQEMGTCLPGDPKYQRGVGNPFAAVQFITQGQFHTLEHLVSEE